MPSPSQIRAQQSGHKKLLNRGRSSKWLQYSLLGGAAIAAVIGIIGISTMGL
ncbi:hypothetical protein [Glaciibacter superstes]|uniref:hypothetical protein n=1 Tax=Glaciibacter superstes TaxID=501023 RepID=UPI0003B3E9E7|nr:hypothetical protein [Glaciibacter superstes]